MRRRTRDARPALAAIRAIAKSVPDAVVGAGTIVSAGQIDEAVEAGARFLVSPGAPPELARAAAEAPVPFLPGCATATEAMALRELGFRALKLFPAEAAGGAKLIASLAAPLPDLRFCPTGGIDLKKILAITNEKNPRAGSSGVRPLTVVAGARSQCHYDSLSSYFVISGLTPAAA